MYRHTCVISSIGCCKPISNRILICGLEAHSAKGIIQIKLLFAAQASAAEPMPTGCACTVIALGCSTGLALQAQLPLQDIEDAVIPERDP